MHYSVVIAVVVVFCSSLGIVSLSYQEKIHDLETQNQFLKQRLDLAEAEAKGLSIGCLGGGK